MLLFLLISILEGVGYLSRAAFLMDRLLARFGLEGRAFVALLSSFACAVPGIMATRTLPSAKERIATMMARAADDLLGAAAGLRPADRAAGAVVRPGGAVRAPRAS